MLAREVIFVTYREVRVKTKIQFLFVATGADHRNIFNTGKAKSPDNDRALSPIVVVC
jgi:hypothetical protein